MDSIDRERFTEQDEVRERDPRRREEFFDRRGMEFAVFGGGGDQCRSVNEQRGLQLRGIGINRCDDGR
jgi:hypothetical protein